MIIKTADLHLTSLPRDEYRWEFLNWLFAKVKELKASRVDILGDLTDKKNFHSEQLVNRAIEALSKIAAECSQGVVVLQGNHDYIDENKAFFRFLSKIPMLKFVDQPSVIYNELFLPSTKKPLLEWTEISFFMHKYDCINIHQLIDGSSVGETKFTNTGLTVSDFRDCKKVFSGDVHIAQEIGNIEYVGAPYPINFGDSKGHILLTERGVVKKKIKVPSIQKLKVIVENEQDLDDRAFASISSKDQLKFMVKLHESELYQWKMLRDKIKQTMKEKGVQYYSVEFEKIKKNKRIEQGVSTHSPSLVFEEFAKKEKLSESIVSTGRSILKGLF